MQWLFDHTVIHSVGDLAIVLLVVLMVGLSKGGLGGAFAMLAVPVLALIMSPVQAAALMLPILIMMDAISVQVWWRQWDLQHLKVLLPSALLGVGAGWALVAVVSDALVLFVLGVMSLLFVLKTWLQTAPPEPAKPNAKKAAVWGSLAGFTSFVSHSGGPPFQMYMLPLRMPPQTYTATSVLFFTVVNLVKVPPYLALSQFSTETLVTGIIMAPLAIVSTRLGAWVVRRMNTEFFYRYIYLMLFVIALKLIYDGLSALF